MVARLLDFGLKAIAAGRPKQVVEGEDGMDNNAMRDADRPIRDVLSGWQRIYHQSMVGIWRTRIRDAGGVLLRMAKRAKTGEVSHMREILKRMKKS